MNVVYVETAAGLARAAEAIGKASVLGVDIEADSLHCYFEKVCFVQVRADETIYLIDTIALDSIDPLPEFFADPNVLKILHGADYDILSLSRDYDTRFANVFDTMLASQFSDREQLGLAALCLEHFGAVMDKTMARHNWALRPVEDRYLGYIAADVQYLPELVKILEPEVRAKGREEEFRLECEWVAQLRYQEKPFDEEGYRRIKCGRGLEIPALNRLKALYLERDAIARDLDRPPFKVINNDVLCAIARNNPKSLDVLLRDRGLKKIGHRFGEDIFRALERAEAGEVVIETKRKKPDADAQARIDLWEALRKWRAKTAKKEACASAVILPKHAMSEVVERRPTTPKELAQIPYFGARRRARYGDQIMDVVRGS